jgi:hypothetical protein
MVINPFLLVPPSMLDSLPTKHKLPERHDNVLRQGQPSNSQLLLVGPPLILLTQQSVLPSVLEPGSMTSDGSRLFVPEIPFIVSMMFVCPKQN